MFFPKNRLKIIWALVFLALYQVGSAQSSEIRKGNEYYKRGQYIEAQWYYEKALQQNSCLVEAHFNIGNVYFQQERYDEAIVQYKIALSEAELAAQRSTIYFNLGSAFFYLGQLEEALSAFKSCLLNNPKDQAARYNYEFIRNVINQKIRSGHKSDSEPEAGGSNEQGANEASQGDSNETLPDPSNRLQQPLFITKEEAEKLLDNLEREEKKTPASLLKEQENTNDNLSNQNDW
jgi:Ca-activated chloride channel family protein